MPTTTSEYDLMRATPECRDSRGHAFIPWPAGIGKHCNRCDAWYSDAQLEYVAVLRRGLAEETMPTPTIQEQHPDRCYDVMAETPGCSHEHGHDWRPIQGGEGGFQCVECGAWYDWTQACYVAILEEMKREACPHPPDRRHVSTSVDAYPRRGCRECDSWIDPVVLRTSITHPYG